ncbi:MAG: hypothetical protein HFE63_09510 [Clostridiales bacterium]|nr:hypothetical protein [Clostridiales bacterium]
MEKLSLDSIRRDSIGKIFDIVSRGGSYTRAAIAAETELSVMTVGKLTDILEKSSALIQEKRESESVGRKSSAYRLNDKLGIMVFDLTGKINKIYIFDLLLSLKSEHEFELENCSNAAAEAFFDFTGDGEQIIGSVCLLPDSCEPDLYKRFCGLYGHRPELAEVNSRAAAIANASRFDASSSIHIFVDGGNVTGGAIIRDGQVMRGSFGHAGDIKRLSALGYDLPNTIAAASLVLDPELVRVECRNTDERDRLRIQLTDVLDTLLSDYEFQLVVESCDEGRSAAYGAALLMRAKWINGLA